MHGIHVETKPNKHDSAVVCAVHSYLLIVDLTTAGVSVIRVSGPKSGPSLAALCSKGSKMPAERQVRELM